MAGQQIAIIHFFFVFLLPTIWKSFQNSYTFQGYKTKEKKKKKKKEKKITTVNEYEIKQTFIK